MKVDKVYCLFEQSGTFKKAFRELNIEAEDYDILNDFGETDYQLDLFAEIDKAFEGNKSIFDNFTPIDADRRLNGDYYKKPTQYWFLNCSPEQNVIFEALPVNEFGITHAVERANKEYYEQVGAKDRKTMRSMIHPDYANRFIRQYILDSDAAYKS